MHVSNIILTTLLGASMVACATTTKPNGFATNTAPVENLWFERGQQELALRKSQKHNNGRAKNVILFVADGMDPTTVTAARIFDGQSRGEEGVDLKDGRPKVSQDEVIEHSHLQHALVPTGAETHGGQDVSVYASGPKAHLISGVFEQNYFFHVMFEALELGQR